jgi:antitoxin HicB
MSKSVPVHGRVAEYSCVVRQASDGQVGFVAEFVDVPGCFAVGNSRQEAMEAGEIALGRWLERAAMLGIVPPKPGSGRGATGHLRIRTPKTVHRQLALLANELRLSLNEVVIQLCYRAVARDFDQQAVDQAGLCNVVGPNRDTTRRPRESRFDPNGEYSGSWLQRMPGQLHLQLVGWAQNEGVTINLLVNYVLVRELERRRNDEARVAGSREAA